MICIGSTFDVDSWKGELSAIFSRSLFKEMVGYLKQLFLNSSFLI